MNIVIFQRSSEEHQTCEFETPEWGSEDPIKFITGMMLIPMKIYTAALISPESNKPVFREVVFYIFMWVSCFAQMYLIMFLNLGFSFDKMLHFTDERSLQMFSVAFTNLSRWTLERITGYEINNYMPYVNYLINVIREGKNQLFLVICYDPFAP